MESRDESYSPIPVGELNDDSLRAYLRARGLTLRVGEARRVAELLGRPPTLAEMTLFDTMWSEHCSYKSSRPYLKKHLPWDAANVIIGPVEDSGIVDFGEVGGRRWGVIMAHESHNHPSQVMPVEGAATGIGGIVRDVYCMGGEVIAVMDALRFGWPAPEGPDDRGDRHRRDIADQVVTGIWEYGNALGVPNLGGDVAFHRSYDENCLVNVVAIGLVDQAHITHSRVPAEAAREPYDLVLVGKPTDWSGMGGAAFASADLDAQAATENKGSVQTPDPFLKRVLTVANRAALAFCREQGAVIGFKDLGAGGVACVTSELCDAGGFGCDVDLALVHQIADLPARVCACSETQERYGLAIPARLTERVLQIYNEDFALPAVYDGACAQRIGRVTAERRYVLRRGSRILADAPIDTITEGIRYDRPLAAPERAAVAADARLPERPAAEIPAEWIALAGHPNAASREFLYRHYDPEVQAATILRPGEADAGVVAPIPGSRRAIAMTCDGNPLVGLADPWAAGARAVVEACRNVVCVGGEPAAITDCLNFGSPEVPRAMWQFAESVRGIGEACRALGRLSAPREPLPVISGNVSFYNQSASGRAVAPSPIVACVGVVDDYRRCRSQRFKEPGDRLYLVGRPSRELGASLYLDAGFSAGRPALPDLDFAAVRAELAGVLSLVRAGIVNAVHDISDGGLAVALLEMAIGLEGQRRLGARLQVPADLAELTLREVLFSEAGGFVASCPAASAGEVEKLLSFSGCQWWPLGEVTADPRFRIAGARGAEISVEVAALADEWQRAVPRLFGAEAAAAAVPAPALAVDGPLPVQPGPAVLGRRPRLAVLQLPGVNCEDESARAIEHAGGSAEIFRWTRPAADLARFDGYVVPGGFSYQDRVRAGAVAAKDPLLEVLREAAAGGKPILGICNGCQVLVEGGIVPGQEPGAVEVALAANRYPGRRGYHSQWVFLAPAADSRCAFVEGLPASIPLPMAHAEGRFTHKEPDYYARLGRAGLVALRFRPLAGGAGGNPNGSQFDTAGLSNPGGNVLALMPHPERALLLRAVPEDLPHGWGRLRRDAAADPERLEAAGPGFWFFRRLVELC
ncbi:MAG TPA: phosphoribosylformylglycinamidine synthase subunit PurL [Candidatus Krumholzibacteria bacterium]|nr:phosphoribosylformylglycinamidine synthase subunit PurL [Candidatus Krumholzibacteria bacterium]HPD72684.1 phosphoribosylformylglycinamidine synthase subunit PurL [Candidatus Krumholzibacteria bacterium]HRY40384.1 phosphoribosylformylglycinamidine synthase subunit PurL [Candidatus Krumholzibacteria bacterium]